MLDKPSCSIVVPVYNGQDSLPELVRQLFEVLPDISSEFEIILVNDGSQDASWEVIQELARGNARIVGINLMRNYGQHNALLCGLRKARYAITITMDDDLQHPPKEIHRLLEKLLLRDFDVVYGIPNKLPHSFWRNALSRLTKLALANAMGIRSIKDLSAFRAMRTELRSASESYRSPTVILDVLLSWGTTKFATVPVDIQPRVVGKSNYNFFKLVNQAMLVMTGFSTAPLRIASLIGFLFVFWGVLLLFYIIAVYFIEGSIPGFPFLSSIIVIFSGAQLFALGIIGEYLGNIFNRSMDRPTYQVKDVLNADAKISFEQ